MAAGEEVLALGRCVAVRAYSYNATALQDNGVLCSSAPQLHRFSRCSTSCGNFIACCCCSCYASVGWKHRRGRGDCCNRGDIESHICTLSSDCCRVSEPGNSGWGSLYSGIPRFSVTLGLLFTIIVIITFHPILLTPSSARLLPIIILPIFYAVDFEKIPRAVSPRILDFSLRDGNNRYSLQKVNDENFLIHLVSIFYKFDIYIYFFK